MPTVALGLFCKTPAAGSSKTRLSPPLAPEACGLLSAAFIRDIAATIGEVCDGDVAEPYAVYSPIGTEPALRRLLPAAFRLLPQCDGAFGARLLRAIEELLARGHRGAILVNADSPTLPASILSAAVAAVRDTDAVVLSPAMDGGYTLIGLSRSHARVFEDIAWSTPHVYQQTVQRVAEVGVPVCSVPGWYDVDDASSLRLLEAELAGQQLPFAVPGLRGAPAPATRRFLKQRLIPVREGARW